MDKVASAISSILQPYTVSLNEYYSIIIMCLYAHAYRPMFNVHVHVYYAYTIEYYFPLHYFFDVSFYYILFIIHRLFILSLFSFAEFVEIYLANMLIVYWMCSLPAGASIRKLTVWKVM